MRIVCDRFFGRVVVVPRTVVGCDRRFDRLWGSHLQTVRISLLKRQSQPTTVLLRTTPTQTINQLQTLSHLGHNQQQSFSGLHQPRRSTNYKHWVTWVTTNNSPSQDYTNPDDQPTTNIESPGSQPTTVLLRTTPTQTINQLQTLTHLGSSLSLYYCNIYRIKEAY